MNDEKPICFSLQITLKDLKEKESQNPDNLF